MKKLVSIFLALTLVFVASFSFESVSFAADDDLGIRLKNSNTFYKYDNDTKTLYINGTGDIPNLSNNSSSIPWFDWADDKIQNVVVAEGITSIGNYVFYQVGATSFSLPRSLKKIGRYSLSCTRGMKEWTLPFGVQTISDYAFYNCIYMEKLNLPSSVKTIGDSAFYNCRSLKSVNIPSSVTAVGRKSFYGCSSLGEVNFASLTQTTAVSLSAFLGCSSLKSVDIPMNTSCNTQSFGYANSLTKVDGFTMGVFKNSLAYSYAVGNGFDYTLIDSVPVKCGVEYAASFTDDNINDTFHYTFTPDKTQEYVLYSMGGCDTYAKLYLDGELIAENDDIDKSLNGFGIKQKLEKGKTYDLFVGSMKMTGNFSVRVYPLDVNAFSIYNGKITMSAADGRLVGNTRIFNITKNMLSNFVVDLDFADGTSDSLYLDEYIAGEHVKIVDNQRENPFSCGENKATLLFGDKSAEYSVYIEHSYAEKVVEPTADDDGYTLHYCINCDVSYKDNFVPTTSYVITGNCVMDEDDFGGHPHNVPYSNVYITVDGRKYSVNSDGTFTVRTFEDCYITFNNLYGGNAVRKVDVTNNGSYNIGTIALEGYDLNGDGYVNAKDYAIYYKEMREKLGDDYWQFGDNFLIWQ